MTESFVYCWTDHKRNKLYIGYHKGNPDDGYVCSSGRMLAAYKKRPESFTRQIIASGTAHDMMKFESLLLRTLKVKDDPGFYNLSENNPPPLGNTKKGRIPWNKGKSGVQVAWNKGKIGEDHHNYGKKYDVKIRQRHSDEWKETKRQFMLSNNPLKIKQQCPHCSYYGPKARWHWDNCRNKGEVSSPYLPQ